VPAKIKKNRFPNQQNESALAKIIFTVINQGFFACCGLSL